MPTLDENRRPWDRYNWLRGGDEWSDASGNPAAQSHGTLVASLYPWLPTGTLLKIAPGLGRWTQFPK